MKNFDDILKSALTPNDKPDFYLDQKILSHAKEERQMKPAKIKLTIALCSAALALGIGSVSIYAARKLLLPERVKEQFFDFDTKLLNAFSGEDALLINETQNGGGYDVTLLGIVSGKGLSESVVTSNGEIHDDRTYAIVSIRHSDNTPMPSTSDDAYGEENFLVSPLIEGYKPWLYNSFTMSGVCYSWVEDGVMYQIAECDNVEVFADRSVYLCVLGEAFYNNDAYQFDEVSGKITRNESYDGLNALFDLPLDASKADPKAAAEYIKSIDSPDNALSEEISSEKSDLELAADEFAAKLTPENIDEYAKPEESTRKVLTPDAEGFIQYEYDLEGLSGGSGTSLASNLFPDGKPGMSDSFGYSYSEDGISSLVIETFTLNEDGTITYVVYTPIAE